MMRDSASYQLELLTSMNAALVRIRQYTDAIDEPSFLHPCSAMMRDAVVWNLTVIAKAAADLVSMTPALSPMRYGLPLLFAVHMQEALPAARFIDNRMLWRTVQELLPVLQVQVKNMLTSPVDQGSSLESPVAQRRSN